MRFALSLIGAVLIPLLGCGPDWTHEECIQHLAAGTPHEQVRDAIRLLDGGGVSVFPSLIAHFPDTQPAEFAFFAREVVDVAADGSTTVHVPTVGEACFSILQGQVEGNWPKGYRSYYVLTPDNAKTWLGAHSGMTLAQFRVAAAEESLRRAEADAKADPQGYAWITAFLRKHLEKAKHGPWDGE